MMKLFRRTEREDLSLKIIGAPPPAGQDDDDAIARRIQPMMRQLEDDVLLTMRIIGFKAQTARDRIDDSIGLVEEIGRESDALAGLARAAKDVTAALARTTQALDISTQTIDRQAASADVFIADTRLVTDDVAESTRKLTEAVTRITGVVQVITSIARRTNLLALNAGIEAARAGAAGRGFVVIANEIKSLAQQVHKATEDVSAQTSNLQAVARHNGQVATRITGLVNRIEPVFGAIRQAVDGLVTETREVSRRAAQSDNFVSSVTLKASAVKKISGEAIDAAREAGDAGIDMNTSVNRLTQRAIVFLRHSASGNRRKHERVPLKLTAQLGIDGDLLPVMALDISLGGILLMSEDKPLPINTSGYLRIAGVGSMPVTVVATSELGMHMRFDNVDEVTQEKIGDLIDRVHADNIPLIAHTQGAAAAVAAAFETGLDNGEVAIEELITIDYRPVAGTNPVQYDTVAMGFYEKSLPPILETFRQTEPKPLFVLPQDKNAFCPVHHPELSQPQRPGEVKWNDLHARNRRILDRWQTLIGARNQEPYLLRAYIRHDPDGTKRPILMIACPVFVRGHFWGNVQIGFDY